jgi:hypothetical protein
MICGASGTVTTATVDSLALALNEAELNEYDPFVIIERSDQHYMQCLIKGRWVLEKREGDEDRHFKATRKWDGSVDIEKRMFLEELETRGESLFINLCREEVEEVMISYILDTPEPDWLLWNKISL